jgi:hypothetical protein
MKNSRDTIGKQTHDLPFCSAVPRPTAPPRVPLSYVMSCCLRSSSYNMLDSFSYESPFVREYLKPLSTAISASLQAA